MASVAPPLLAAPPPPLLAYAALNACTVLWGTQHAVVKRLADSPLPSLVNAIRFSAAAVVTIAVSAVVDRCGGCSTPTSFEPAEREGLCGLLIGAAELGAWQTLGFSLQLVGLRYTTASRSAFLLYASRPLTLCPSNAFSRLLSTPLLAQLS